MTTGFSIAFLVSLAGMGGLGIYGLFCFFREMIQEKAWGVIAFSACLLIFLASTIALSALGVFPESAK